MRKSKRIFKKYLILTIAVIIALLIVLAFIKKTSVKQAIRYVEVDSLVKTESEYIISEQMVKSKLETKAQIVSLEQSLQKKELYIDSGLFGKRETELDLTGSYKMGLDTKDINIKHIDSASRTVYLELPDPIFISLEIPYDQIKFTKKSGWMRREMSEEDRGDFYKTAMENIRLELDSDEDLARQAMLFNQDVIEGLLTSATEIKTVVFE